MVFPPSVTAVIWKTCTIGSQHDVLPHKLATLISYLEPDGTTSVKGGYVSRSLRHVDVHNLLIDR